MKKKEFYNISSRQAEQERRLAEERAQLSEMALAKAKAARRYN
jgi:hypothetical protein